MRRILTVDDSASIRQMVSFTLTKAGYEVAEAVDGRDGLAKAGGARADLVICRAGAGAVAELAAAGKPSILVPLPTAADQHQLRNAEAFQRAGASVLVLDAEMDGGRLFEEVEKLRTRPELLQRMGERVRAFAHPDAARRAANVLEEAIGH